MQLLTPKDMLRYNAHQVLRLFKDNTEHSRADVARIVGCSRSTGSNIMQYLEEHNLVLPCGTGNDGVGRSSILYRFNPDARCGVGVEVTEHTLSFVMANLQGDILKTAEYPLIDHDPDKVAKAIRNGCHCFLDDWQGPREHILGIGVMFPGPVSIQGQVMRSVPLSWPDPVNLQSLIRGDSSQCSVDSHTEPTKGTASSHVKQLPAISIMNDANAKALAEVCFNLKGDGPDAGLIYLDNHNGFGSGFVDDQLNLMSGATATAMEVGKMYVGSGGAFVQADSFLVIHDKERLAHLEHTFNQTEGSLAAADDAGVAVTAINAGATTAESMGARSADVVGVDIASSDVAIISDIFAQIIAQLATLFNPKTVLLDVPYIKSEVALGHINKALCRYIFEGSLISRPNLGLPVVRKKHPALGGVAQAFLQSPFDFVIKRSVF